MFNHFNHIIWLLQFPSDQKYRHNDIFWVGLQQKPSAKIFSIFFLIHLENWNLKMGNQTPAHTLPPGSCSIPAPSINRSGTALKARGVSPGRWCWAVLRWAFSPSTSASLCPLLLLWAGEQQGGRQGTAVHGTRARSANSSGVTAPTAKKFKRSHIIEISLMSLFV